MNRFVVDTNFFVNMEIKSGFGTTSKEIMIELSKAVKPLKGKVEIYMPPSIVMEMDTFFENQPFYKELLSFVIIKSPDISQVQFPASIFYKMVEEIRERSYRGLKIAEESVETGTKKGMNITSDDRRVFQESVGEVIKNLRERYRQATRFNFLDSVADLDLIVLSKELNASLVSSDEGVIRWGRIFGIKEVLPHSFQQVLHECA
jgi:RNA ligase partner protein